ncbi:MAG: hypothetical protein AB7O88_19565 [Reyranellaceae bacterium]
MAGHMLLLAPAAIFAAALVLALDVPQRLKNVVARHWPRAPASARS